MKVIDVRNVQEALPRGLNYLLTQGVKRDSRNGPVYVSPCPVTTVYNRPRERVIFWEDRDANPFFHLYEALWMLQGRNDIAPLLKYNKRFGDYSDDGKIQRGAYGHRWRWKPDDNHICGFDQLTVIAARLKAMPDDRRSGLQMWNSNWDLREKNESVDVPCNMTATFQRDENGRLDLHVFCRSNDIIWGAYGANAVHFSLLQEYMALWIGCPVGKFYQISVNYHAYANVIEGMKGLLDRVYRDNEGYDLYQEGMRSKINDSWMNDPRVYPTELTVAMHQEAAPMTHVDGVIRDLLQFADEDRLRDIRKTFTRPNVPGFKWANIFWIMLEAHEAYRDKKEDGSHYSAAIKILNSGDPTSDWLVAGRQWMERRQQKWSMKKFDEQIKDMGV